MDNRSRLLQKVLQRRLEIERGEKGQSGSGVDLFVSDLFNFEGFQPLGFWDFKKLRYEGRNVLGTLVGNGIFQQFRERTRYGRDFHIVSPLEKVNDFEEYCWRAPW